MEYDAKWKPVVMQGMYMYENSDLYNGFISIHGAPRGCGVMYYWESGECDVGYFEGRELKGPGVRFSWERDAAYEIADGQVSGTKLTPEEGCKLAGLKAAPERMGSQTP